jgi:hypothetical protein
MGIERTVKGLADAVVLALRPPVGGAMARSAGRPYSRARLADSESIEPDAVDGIRAYPVPALVGVILAAPTEAELPGALEALLRLRVCAFDWRVEPRISGPIRKYGLLHTSLDAPIDERRGEPMWLELAGDVVTVGGVPVDGRAWMDVRSMPPSALLGAALPGPIEIRIAVATYSNTRYPGVGVPFYS